MICRDVLRTVALATAIAVLAAAGTACALGPQAVRRVEMVSGQPQVEEVLQSVRRAVRYEAVVRLPTGFSIREQAGAGGETRLTWFGTRRGELRQGDAYGYDGLHRWQQDERRGFATPVPLRLHEKTAWPLWVRGHWWLNPRSGIKVRLITEESNERQVAMGLTQPDGLVEAVVFIDRATWLPARLVVPYERGPYTAEYSDYQRTELGFLMPATTRATYRESQTSSLVGIAPLPRGATFRRPTMPADFHFDSAAPAVVPARLGPDFAGGLPGHTFLQAAVNGEGAGWFLFDSGSDGMQIDAAIADRLGLEVIGRTRSMGADGRPREATIRRARSFQVGRLTYRNPVLIAVDLSSNNAPPGERRGGVIGYDVFARSVVEFGPGGHAAICDASSYRLPSPGRWQVLQNHDLTPAVRTRFEGDRQALFQVDTGAAGAVDFYTEYVDAARLLEGRQTRGETTSGAGGNFEVLVGRLAWIEFGGRRFDNVDAVFRRTRSREGAAGVIGRELMKPFLIVFDYPNQRIAFIPREKLRVSTGCS
jgi:hypothetical protein